MMKRKVLNEDRRLPKYPVKFSDDISNLIEDIISHNRFEKERLKEWNYFLESMVSRISDPVIAWDNTNIFQHEDDGTTHIQIDGSDGYDVSFTFREDEKTGKTYISINSANLRIREHGLELPFGVFENNRYNRSTHQLNESDISNMQFVYFNETLYWTSDCIRNKMYAFINPNKNPFATKFAFVNFELRDRKKCNLKLFKKVY